ncbi:hypothetical protein O181_075149 [Austropuccinia psidii MF-1]|uniref:Uncharacterized protein n=1 Tax=Austropuccinia psidii MF-1 TaxID=1389203 RepID=A0A9Q3IE59_9BASI|nr:hypothetical protein [Austropuccinia psidii MF-1]
MDKDKEEEGTGPDLASLPQERHIWRMPEFPPIPQGDFLRAEPFPSGSHRNISVPVQKLVHSSQGKGLGNISKTLTGGYELVLTHKELSGSGEDHKALRRMESIVFPRKDQKGKELVEETNYSIQRPEERVRNDPRFGEGRPNGISQIPLSSRGFQRQAQRTSEEEERFH